MATMNNSAVVYVDSLNNTVHYFALLDNKYIHDARKLKARLFTEEYYAKFTEAVREFVSKYTPVNAANTTIVLDDNLVFTNTVAFPALKGVGLKNSVDAYLANTYKNLPDLNIETYTVSSNKQCVNICMIGVRKDVVYELKKACTEARLIAQNVTFASNATICGLCNISVSYRNNTYLFLDIKETFSRFVIVFKGRAIGFYGLPFGYDILVPNKVAAEDVLLYHPVAELAVINAREKAKQKALTMMGSGNVTDIAEDENEEKDDEEENSFAGSDNLVKERQTENIIKSLPKKVARKLPKFMLREIPADEERKVYENFRLFIKWSLGIINGNDKITSLGEIDTIYVNMPSEFDYLYDIINEEKAENGVKFASANIAKEKEDIVRNLEMYGAFFAKDSKLSTNFK
mgnify:CR=1 FL=1